MQLEQIEDKLLELASSLNLEQELNQIEEIKEQLSKLSQDDIDIESLI